MGLHSIAFDCGVVVDTEVQMVDERGTGAAPEAMIASSGQSARIDGELDAGALEVLASLAHSRAQRGMIAFGEPEPIRRHTAAAVELFPTSRLFRDSSGWYVTLRKEDHDVVSRLKVPGYSNEGPEGVVVGPFASREELDRWLGAFLVLFGTERDEDSGNFSWLPGPLLMGLG